MQKIHEVVSEKKNSSVLVAANRPNASLNFMLYIIIHFILNSISSHDDNDRDTTSNTAYATLADS